MRLHAGGNWNNSSNCGSQCRNANNYRWNTNTNIGARFASDTRADLILERNSWLGLPAMFGTTVPSKIQSGGQGELVGPTAERSPNHNMKRHGNLWDQIIDIHNLYRSYQMARKGKSWQDTIHKFDNDFDNNLFAIQDALTSQTFHTAPYKEKQIYEPKERTIYILPFSPDRIVHHALMRIVEPIWERMFIHDSYACRVGKGIHAGSKKTMEFVRRFKYCLKMDISKFYPSVDHDILYRIITRKIKCARTLWLIRDIIYSYPGGTNVPIGNYTSQWFGNLYMNELDQFLKHDCKVGAYLRYCDDFCLFHDDKNYLGNMARMIQAFLASRLKLRLSKCDLFPVSRGVDFLGYRHFPKYILVRKSTAKRVRKRLRALPWLLVRGKITLDHYRSSLASTRGWLKWANAHHFRLSLNIDSLEAKCLV
jgi:RNA-directed DNA polymerase